MTEAAKRTARHQVQLLVSAWCPTCPAAEQVWRQVAEERDIRLSVVDMAQPEGRELVARLRLRSVPSVVVDGVLAAVGVQTPAQARSLVADAPPRPKGSAYHAGIMLSRDNRAFIVSAMAWLAACAAMLLVQGGLPAAVAPRAAALHVLLAGAVLMLIYGLGAHMLPRFTGQPVRAGVWAWLQLALAHLGATGLAAGPLVPGTGLWSAGGVAATLALALFFWRMWPALEGRPPPQPGNAIRIVPVSQR